ncbi:MAG: hypothetical protein ACRBCI_13185 [Cellvibrionaceae bacterium]
MDSFSLYITGKRDFYNVLPARQRLILFFLCLSVLYFFWFLVVSQPMNKSISRLKLENAYLYSQYHPDNMVKDAGDVDLISLNKKLRDLKKRVVLLNEELINYFSVIDSVDEIVGVVKGLIDSEGLIAINEIKEMPVTKIAIPSSFDINRQDESENKEWSFYKHEIQIKLTGDYINIVKYLNKIELLEWNLFIENIKYDVIDHPKSAATIALYALSMDGDL